MSARMNGYASDRERRPASEQMADLHVYLVPPDIWREKYHNALNQNINETVSLGFIRVHPETKIYALRDEIEKQLGDQDIPREYVFVKSVGRSLTRLKSRQETTLKVKNFLPPQAYAPELYLLEATPEVRQQIAASSENSTRPQSRTSYDYEFMQRQRFTPDTYRENEPLDRRKVDNLENDRLKAPSPEGERLNRSQDDNDLSDWERRRQEEQDEARRQEEERRRREEEEARRDEQEREDIAEQAKLQKSDSDQELTRYPSPPPLRLASPDRDTASARARRMKQKEELLRELEEAREERRAAERQREELVKHAKQMQTKTQNRRNHARDLWKKRYFEEKKKTGPLEEQCNRLRHELDIIHKKLLTTLEGPREKATKLNDIKPSNKVGSPGRPLVSSDINTSRTRSPVASPAPNTRAVNTKSFENKGYNSPRQASPTREIASPDFDSLRSKYNSQRMSLRVDSPNRGRSNSPIVRNSTTQVRKSESFREKPTPRQGWTEVSSSPRQSTHRGRRPVMTSNELDKFSLHFIKAKKEHQQHPVDLVGSDRKQEYFESEQFDSDYDSKQSSARSILATKSPDRLNGTPRKNVQFDKNVNVIPQEQN